LPSSVATFGRLTFVILALTFVALLGGFHPTDAVRDGVLAIVGVLIVLVNVPTVLFLVRSRKTDAPTGAIAFALAVRLVAAVCVLWFVHGISHEQPGP
jgi:hypothetical protein